MTNPLFPAFYRQPQRRAMIKQETKILCIFVQLLMPTYRSRFPRNKQTYGFGCFHLKVSLRWRRQRLSFVKTFRTTNRRVDYVHWHAPRAVRLHYMKLALFSRLRDICITHCWEHRARPPTALENELSTRMSIQAKIKALGFYARTRVKSELPAVVLQTHLSGSPYPFLTDK